MAGEGLRHLDALTLASQSNVLSVAGHELQFYKVTAKNHEAHMLPCNKAGSQSKEKLKINYQ